MQLCIELLRDSKYASYLPEYYYPGLALRLSVISNYSGYAEMRYYRSEQELRKIPRITPREFLERNGWHKF